MSVLIKGMEMPTRCFSCPMCDVENAEVNCAISHGSYIEYREIDPKVAIQERPSWCPLIEVPPHGRLIDADAVERNLVKMQMAQKGVVGHGIRKSRAVVRDMATVIPADKDGGT